MYTEKEMLLWSLICAKTKSVGRLEVFQISPLKLFNIFKKSCEIKVNLFIISYSEKEKFFNENNIEINEVIFNIFFDEDYRNHLLKQVSSELDIMKKKGIKFITYFSKDYPLCLKDSSLPPFVVYYCGFFPSERDLKRSLAIIGTRTPLEKNIKIFTEKLALNLKEKIVYNISGLAQGCDTIGHIETLKVGIKNLAILGQGLATTTYPKTNSLLLEKILERKGAIISEIPPSISIKPIYLLQRNRLQVYFSEEIIVLETGSKGGTIQTLKFAFKEKKRVFFRDIGRNRETVIKNNLKKIGFRNEKFIPFKEELTLFK